MGLLTVPLHEQLRAARRAAGMTVREAAELLRVRPHTIIRWENGLHVPRADAYLDAMRVYGGARGEQPDPSLDSETPPA